MIYKNLKSIFVRIYKTGTTSVLKALQNNQDSVDFKFKIYNKIFFDYLHLTKKKKFPKHLMVDTHSKAIDFRDFLKKEYEREKKNTRKVFYKKIRKEKINILINLYKSFIK